MVIKNDYRRTKGKYTEENDQNTKAPEDPGAALTTSLYHFLAQIAKQPRRC